VLYSYFLSQIYSHYYSNNSIPTVCIHNIIFSINFTSDKISARNEHRNTNQVLKVYHQISSQHNDVSANSFYGGYYGNHKDCYDALLSQVLLEHKICLDGETKKNYKMSKIFFFIN